MASRTVSLSDRTTHVLIWALGLHADPTVNSIQIRWNVSRATAYRWRTKLCDARRIWEMHARKQSGWNLRAPDIDAVPLGGLFQ